MGEMLLSFAPRDASIFHFSRADEGDIQDCDPIEFGVFVALPAARTLLRMGRPIDIGGRAFDLLLVLLRARGTIVAKDEIVRQVWPSTFVDESNLRFQMATLRKVLGDARAMIKTVTGRGYLFVDGPDDLEFRQKWTPSPAPRGWEIAAQA
jgi:DNA-binding winged helix-turn-helix (wHTH) protein